MRRDENRIDYILSYLKTIWMKYPDLRLGQLLTNVTNYTTLYYLEDASLINHMINFYKVDVSNLKQNETVKELAETVEVKKEEIKATERDRSFNKGKVYIHKGDIVKSIYKEELENYLSAGFVLGRKDK